MTTHSATIGKYTVSYDDAAMVSIKVVVTNAGLQNYGSVPTEDACNEALGTSGLPLDLSALFKSAGSEVATYNLPDRVYMIGGQTDGCYRGASALLYAPKLPTKVLHPGVYNFGNIFRNCSNLLEPAVVPNVAMNVYYMYASCDMLKWPVSFPPGVTRMNYVYDGCTNITGEFCIKATTLTSCTNALRNTTRQLTIYGDRSVCEAVAATANNGNASWSAWYEPQTPVTNRGQGSRTTAEDMTRIVRNGALAVPSFAPGRMVYNQGDFVREDEWYAICHAASVIDPSITMSTHYSNLNKIEAAFGSAL